MTRPLSEQVVVLTGASSGIGKETAVELGRRGATVVLAARNEEGLRDTARLVEEAGGTAAVVPTDVASWEEVKHLADETVRRFGRIDTWVNDAAVSLYATVEEARVDEIEQVLKVNLLGCVYGMKAVLPLMKRQNSGTIVNVSSVLGNFSVPLQAAYCASKHGILGFADSLRLELKREGSGVQVCTVMPGSTNTPFFDHARARLGGANPMPLPPAYDPISVARAIAHVAEHPQRDVVVGFAGKLFILLKRLSPSLLDAALLMNDSGAELQTSDRPDDCSDNLTEPSRGVRPARGQWGDEWWSLGDSLYTRLFELNGPARAVAVGAVAVGAVAVLAGLLRSGTAAAETPQAEAYQPVYG